MEKNELRDYLEQIRLLETDIYTMTETLNLLQTLEKQLPGYYPPKEPMPPVDPVLELPTTKDTVAGAVAITLFTTVLGTIPYLIYRKIKAKKVQSEYDAAIVENQIIYERAMADYKKQLAAYEMNYSAEAQTVKLYNENLSTQIASLQSDLNSSQVTLKQLYDLNIIYKKYRNLIAITMFCEYLDSGLRTELEGTNGMYDLYEQQLMGKQIINELSSVNKNLRTISYQIGRISRQLTGIQQNQLMLYEEVAKANSIASDIRRGTEQLLNNSEKHLSAIQSATEMTAFQAEATARRMKAISSMAEYEFEAKHSPYIGI